MMQGYYSLNEAAKALGMSPDDLRAMAQRNQIRSFQDRGTLRFRMQDVQELARRRGASSDADILAVEPKSGPKTPSAPARSDEPKSGPRSPRSPKSPKAPADSPEVFSFALDADDKLDLGGEVKSDTGPKSGPKKFVGGSDSDVKLVAETGPDSDVRLVSDSAAAPKTPSRKVVSGPTSPTPRKGAAPAGVDSGVRLVPIDSDSDVKIIGAGSGSDEVSLGAPPPPSATDSDIRLERVERPASSEEMMLTDEIDLDQELKKQEAAQKKQPKSRVRPKSEMKFPTQSPFELSDSDVPAPTAAASKHPSSSDFELTPGAPKVKDDSSDFDLAPAQPSGADSSGDFSLELPDDNINVGGSGEAELTGPSSGISLSNPVDAGISLEDSTEGTTDEVDLDLSLEAEGTPTPARVDSASDSGSSEFELSLEEARGDSSSDSSEFELTLDDSGADVPALTPQAKASEKDIFETDFEVPALEGESGSDVAALETSDTDLESSDFDLALDDSDLAAEDESGSQVVALDEESADEAAQTIAGELGEELAVEEEVEEVEVGGPVREVVRTQLIEPAPWPGWVAIAMIPTVVVMLLVGIMGFELVQSSAGFRSAGFLTRMMGKAIGQEVR